MIFDIIRSTVGVSKWRGGKGSRSLTFEVVPKDREYLEVGDKYVLSSASYQFLHQDRELITAKVQVTDDPSYIERTDQEAEKDVCGWAAFYPEQKSDLHYSPPALEMVVVVEPALFEELFKLRIAAPDTATMHVDIDGLDYGWEPDGSHKIWKVEEKKANRLKEKKPVTSFWVSVCTFSTTEGAIAAEEERKTNEELAESPDPKVRKLAVPTSALKQDRTAELLVQVRTILLALLMVAAIAVFRR